MEGELLNRLLAEYATGGLSEADKKKLFAAALADQDLFDQLVEEDSLREAIEMPGARNRLIDSLQDDVTESKLAAASVLRMPPPSSHKPVWLAWAAGIGVVFVSGAITFMMFEGTSLKDLAGVKPQDTKPFVAPPARVEKPPKVSVEEPPKILAESRGPALLAEPVIIPLPSAPPPEAVPAKDAKTDEIVFSARARRDGADFAFRANQQTAMPLVAPSQQQPPPPAAPPRRQAVADSVAVGAAAPASPGVAGYVAIDSADKSSAAKEEAAREAKTKLAIAPISLWRRAGDGVWIRVPAGDAIGRNDSVALRYTPVTNATVALLDPAGRRVAGKPGRPGEELELVIPAALLQRAAGDSLTLTVTEGPRSTPLKILFRRE